MVSPLWADRQPARCQGDQGDRETSFHYVLTASPSHSLVIQWWPFLKMSEYLVKYPAESSVFSELSEQKPPTTCLPSARDCKLVWVKGLWRSLGSWRWGPPGGIHCESWTGWWRERHWGGPSMETEAETTERHWEPREARGFPRSSLAASEIGQESQGVCPSLYPDFRLLVSKTVWEEISIFSKPPSSWPLATAAETNAPA